MGRFDIDLSGAINFRYLIALNGLDIGVLNLRGTSVLHSSEFKYLRVKELNLEDTNIDLFHDVLYMPDLQKVVISKGAYGYLDFRKFTNLRIEQK